MKFNQDELVDVASGANLPPKFLIGKIVGQIFVEQPFIGAIYAVDFGEKISSDYPYNVVGIPEIFLKSH